MHIRSGWPLCYPDMGKAPAEFGLGLLYLLRTDEAHKESEAALAAAKIVEREFFAQLRRQSFGH